MSIREAINGKPLVGAGLAGLLLIIAVGIGYQYTRGPSILSRIGTTYYSDDDGQSYYRDSLYKFAPYEHGGKTAVMAMVFSNGEQTFVGLLQRFTPAAKSRLEDEYAKVRDGGEPLGAFNAVMASPSIRNDGTEVKLPGPGNDWVLRSANPKLKLNSPGGGPCWMVSP